MAAWQHGLLFLRLNETKKTMDVSRPVLPPQTSLVLPDYKHNYTCLYQPITTRNFDRSTLSLLVLFCQTTSVVVARAVCDAVTSQLRFATSQLSNEKFKTRKFQANME